MDPNNRFLIAVDASENSRRAVEYTGKVLAGRDDVELTILHILPEVLPDTFDSESSRNDYEAKLAREAEELLAKCRQILLDMGFAPELVRTMAPTLDCPSMAQCILEERKREEFGTLVVGRRGLSRTEEFLFGSVSSSIVHHADNCAVWVVA